MSSTRCFFKVLHFQQRRERQNITYNIIYVIKYIVFYYTHVLWSFAASRFQHEVWWFKLHVEIESTLVCLVVINHVYLFCTTVFTLLNTLLDVCCGYRCSFCWIYIRNKMLKVVQVEFYKNWRRLGNHSLFHFKNALLCAKGCPSVSLFLN